MAWSHLPRGLARERSLEGLTDPAEGRTPDVESLSAGGLSGHREEPSPGSLEGHWKVLVGNLRENRVENLRVRSQL